MIVFALLLVVAAWVAYVFVQEAYAGYRLNSDASQIRRQNDVLAAQNRGYQKDIQAITSGAADEEEARTNGYARPDERLFLLTSPSPASPVSPAPR